MQVLNRCRSVQRIEAVAFALPISLALALAACSQGQDEGTSSSSDWHAAATVAAEAADDAAAASQAIGRSAAPPLAHSVAETVSGGYVENHGSDGCTQDCSGHEAGYQWAADRNITDADDCSGTSNSFIEGCRAYVEDSG